MSLLASLFGAGKSGSAPPGPVSSVAWSDGSKRSGGSAAVNAVDLGEMRAKAATDGEAASVKETAAEEAAEAAVNALRMRSSKRTRSYNPAQAVEKRPRIESA